MQRVFIRVNITNTKAQNPNRQIEQFYELGLDDRHILVDEETRGHFNRKSYNLLIGTPKTTPLLRKGDLLIVTSLDRLGGNYTEMKKQWHYRFGGHFN